MTWAIPIYTVLPHCVIVDVNVPGHTKVVVILLQHGASVDMSCRPDWEVLRSTPKGVLTAQDLEGLLV